METYRFIDKKGTFVLKQPENYSYLYFPVAGENGIKSAVTPNLGGDCKRNQNEFILEPVSAENLHNNRSTRNFWCTVEKKGSWSATGASAEAESSRFTDDQEESELTAGLMWQTLKRRSDRYGLGAEVTSFVPLSHDVELMWVTISNTGTERVTFTPVAAVPIYGRSADNIRDHRHVTSLLHRIVTTEDGVLVKPTLSFDERGHQKNEITYFVCGVDGKGERPEAFYPVAEDYIGEGGSYTHPLAVQKEEKGVPAGSSFAGKEAVGGLRFPKRTLEPGEKACYTILIGAEKDRDKIASAVSAYDTEEKTAGALEEVKEYWKKQVNVEYHTKDPVFDNFMCWVSFQPILRRIYGCSFLPHHDYGKGGRGWRDLWQDCLALLILNPTGVREMLLSNFGGVRMDGTNATIIGEKPGEFVADRNNITRVWMDHGVWPFYTTKLYIDQTGDLALLDEKVTYFKDRQVERGTAVDDAWDPGYGSLQKDEKGEIYRGTVLEHLLLQNLCAFYEVGEHGHIRLRGADWNDALDMAGERGESVAFTNAYAGNLRELADLLEVYREKTGNDWIEIAEEILLLLSPEEKFLEDADAKRDLLARYGKTCRHNISGKTVTISVQELTEALRKKSDWMAENIRGKEWVTDGNGNGWFNGYYDNHGKQVEGKKGGQVRMMLTGQVFPILGQTATAEQIEAITKSADRYLYERSVGGYRLNTDFCEVKTDLGRMFGFAYGEKENGAVFSHMTVMYANALYRRGFVKEGYKALKTLADAAVDFKTSRIYPGIPEYFNAKGRGMYHYLTGAASWYMLTVITQMYGVHGEAGDLVITPKLMEEQFDEAGKALVWLPFDGQEYEITIKNEERLQYGDYRVTGASLDENTLEVLPDGVRIKKKNLEALSGNKHTITVVLGTGR